MTDLFERQLSEQLRTRTLPEAIPGLAERSIAQGQRIRRRRVAVVAMALVLLLAIPMAAWTASRRLADPSPVDRFPVPPTGTSEPVRVELDLRRVPAGPDPYLSTVRGQRIHPPTGNPISLPEDQVGTVAEYWDGFAWLTGSRTDLRLNLSPERLPLPPGADRVAGVEPGPGGSVMVRTSEGPVLLTLDAAFVVPRDPLLRTDGMVATARSLWVEDSGQVVQVDAPDPREGFTIAAEHPQWHKVVVGDPQSDRLVATDEAGCFFVIDGRTAAPLWISCEWDLSAFSPDGRYVAGRHRDGSYGVVDLPTGRWRLSVDAQDASVHHRLAVDNQGRLSLITGTGRAGFAVTTCDLAGTCTGSAAGTRGRMEFVLPNRW